MGALLVLTSTVTPPAGATFLTRVNPADRLNDYLTALQLYLSLPTEVVDRIVVLENSNHPLDPLREVARRQSEKKVELLSFYGLDYPPENGKGYGELMLMDWGFEQSRILRELGPNDTFWKITGRLRVVNLPRLVRTAPRSYELYCDCKTVRGHWLEFRVFSCSAEGYRDLFLGRYRELIGLAPEIHFLDTVVLPQLKSRRIVPRFSVQPWIAGFGGYTAQDYMSKAEIPKLTIRTMLRYVAPWLWI